MAPTADSNIAPQTWITAAPQDTLTTRDENGNLLPTWQPATIPFRFHLYWSGSDQDGSVTGFYWAVVETVASVSGLPPPPLPGPKPQDYRYTTATDSIFIFNVHEATNNRQHAFYIYSVDDKGKADPTPARVIFNAIDRYPPVPVIDQESKATGYIFHPNTAWDGAGPFPAVIETTIALRDTFSRLSQVSDIVPMGSIIYMQWHSELRVADNPAVAYKYKIGEGDEVEFVTVPATVTSTTYNTTDRNRLGPGLKIFTLRAIDQAGGARTSPETTRRFYMNMAPETWIAGPDPAPPSNPNFYSIENWIPNDPTSPIKHRYRQMGTGGTVNWALAFPGSQLGTTDSTRIMAAYRTPRKTFFEVYSEYNFTTPTQSRHRVYLRAEGDTVHLNSWVVLHAGGFDPDSPYNLRILINDPRVLPGIGTTPVLTSGPANGSPIGFRYRIPVDLDSIGPVSTFPQSQVYPLLDPSTVSEPHIAGYQGMQQSGRAYAIVRAEDGNRGLDERVFDPVAFIDSVESGRIGPGHPRYRLRDRIITFYVNRAPYLSNDFVPRFGGTPANPPPDNVYYDRIIKFRFDLAQDDDPYQNNQRSVGGAESGRTPLKILRSSVFIRGRRTGSSPARDTIYAPPALQRRVGVGSIDIPVPDYIDNGPITIEIELCDCTDCEAVPGQGRCRRYPPIYAMLVPPSPHSGVNSSSSGPGTGGESSRSRTP